MDTTKLTTKDIAKLAGVSPAAVSFAINGRKGISDQTRKRILEIVAQTNYRPMGGTKEPHRENIAILFRHDIPTLDQLFYTELNASMIAACDQLPYTLILTSAYHQGNEIILSDVLRSGSIDGVITYGDLERDVQSELNNLGIPIVVLDSSRKSEEQFAVRVDYAMAAYTAAKHLIDLGHRDIAYIGNDKLHDFNLLTFSGFQRATTEHSLPLDMNRIQINVYDEESLYICIDEALKGECAPTALFCATDFYAIHAIRHLHSKGMRVPDDISVVGIDDIAVSKFIIPSLTTVRIDREAMGRYGFELMKRCLNNESRECISLPSSNLIVRESTAPPRRI